MWKPPPRDIVTGYDVLEYYAEPGPGPLKASRSAARHFTFVSPAAVRWAWWAASGAWLLIQIALWSPRRHGGEQPAMIFQAE